MSQSLPARRGRPPLLDEQQVLDAAQARLDAEGLSALSLRRLAADLGVSHMTLYGYFPSKDHLLEALVARTIAVPQQPDAASAPWHDVLAERLREMQRVLVAHPYIAELLVSQQFEGQWVAEARESWLDLLRGAGFPEQEATDGISILFNYLLGEVLIESRRRRGGSSTSFDRGLGYLMAGLVADAPGKPLGRGRAVL